MNLPGVSSSHHFTAASAATIAISCFVASSTCRPRRYPASFRRGKLTLHLLPCQGGNGKPVPSHFLKARQASSGGPVLSYPVRVRRDPSGEFLRVHFPNAPSARPSIALSISIVIRSSSLSFPSSAAVKASIGERPRLSSLQATSASIHSRFPGGISDCLDYASCTALPGHSSPVRSLTRISNVLSSLTSIPSDVGCPLRQRRTLLP